MLENAEEFLKELKDLEKKIDKFPEAVLPVYQKFIYLVFTFLTTSRNINTLMRRTEILAGANV